MKLVNKPLRSLALGMFASAATLSSGCATFSRPAPLPEPPAHLVECAAAAAVEITPGKKTRAEAAELTARIRASELAKGRCAEGWAAWYEGLR